MSTSDLRHFLEFPYDELADMNLEAKKKVLDGMPDEELKNHYVNYLQEERRIKAVTICFSEIT